MRLSFILLELRGSLIALCYAMFMDAVSIFLITLRLGGSVDTLII